ncbi:response regulator [Jiella sp. MQZ9-1]|uniref:Response regulator transcription factor n=1 Tax=Jiella flava TaxID=2816857 RepID=A0A939JXP6_9HYPH|nr:response regulator [Jiella flava]MBO0664312.1 response regulator transcription factor [Jiella flava]MCD2472765.1 response regulator [Jiella flava]
MKTCLIVDEAPVIRKIAFRLLRREGLDVDTLATMAEAGSWIDSHGAPDILIVAANLQDKAIVDEIKILRQRTAGSTRLVAMIVEANLGLMTRLRRAGVENYIYKPFTRQSLEEGLGAYLIDAEEPAVA